MKRAQLVVEMVDMRLFKRLAPAVEWLSDRSGADPITWARVIGVLGHLSVLSVATDWAIRARTPFGVVANLCLAAIWVRNARGHDRQVRRMYAVAEHMLLSAPTLLDLRNVLQVVRGRRTDFWFAFFSVPLIALGSTTSVFVCFPIGLALVSVSGYWATIFTGPGRPLHLRQRITARLRGLVPRPRIAPSPA